MTSPAAFAQEAAEPKESTLPPVVVESETAPPKKAKKQSTAPSPGPVQAAPAVPAEDVLAAEDAAAPDSGSDDPASDNYGSVGYVQTRTTTATKTDTPLIDIPQSITVVTKEQASDQHAVDLRSALMWVPGVIVAQGEGNRDQITIRGQNTTADFFTDGVRDDVQYFRDLYNIDRIEVLKGPNAMIFGRGGGGGVINRVTKKAGETIYEGTVSAGSFDHKRAAVDVGERVTDGFAVRLNGVYEDSGSFRDHVSLERYGINPTAFFKPTDATRIWVSYEYFSDDRTADRGIPSFLGRPAPAPIESFFGDPAASYADFEGHIGTATIEQRFDRSLKIRNHTLVGDYDKFYQNVFAASPVTAGTYQAEAYNNTMLRDSIINQTDLTYRFDTDYLRNTLLVGTEFAWQNTDSFRYNGAFGAAGASRLTVPFADPTFRVPLSFNTKANDNASDLNVASVYVQDQLDFGLIEFIGGLRYERFDIDVDNKLAGTTFGRVDEVVSPRAGIVLKPFEDISFYASYAKSFLPFSGDQFSALDPITETLKPEEFLNREVGVKWDVAPRLAFTAALYRLVRENSRANDPNNPGFSIQTGESEAQGGEAGLTGYVTDEWQIALGYARTYAEITSATTAAPAGRELPLVPTDQFTLWNRYQFSRMWGVGLGVLYRDDMFASISNAVTLPGFTRVDGAVFFDLNENLSAQLNVENILDETYYVNAHNDNNISPGSPRAFYVGLTSRF